MEAMLAARIVSAHDAAMECFRRAVQPDVDDSAALRLRDKAIFLANLATRTLRELRRCQAAPPAYPVPDQSQEAVEPQSAARSLHAAPAPAAIRVAKDPGITIASTPADAMHVRVVNDLIADDGLARAEPVALAPHNYVDSRSPTST
jgi:hypothetical protein